MFEIVDWNFVIKIIKKIFEINDALFKKVRYNPIQIMSYSNLDCFYNNNNNNV
jgi:hypothetical protein